MTTMRGRLLHAWNAFVGNDNDNNYYTFDQGPSSSHRPDRTRLKSSNERSIITSVFTRVAIDVAAIDMLHVRLDDNKNYVETIDSGLNNCLTLDANIDQTGRAFLQDAIMTMMDKGTIAVVPVDTTLDPTSSGGYDIKTLRIGEITTWYPEHVMVSVYNEKAGKREEIKLPKKTVAVIENPLFAVMNDPNSTLQRLIRKLNLLDAVDEASSSGKLDLIIQLPYVIKSEARKQQAQQRKADLEEQLKGSTYGIAYTDATEKITQLNRASENNLLKQVMYLTTMFYGQLGITEEVMLGTADEKTMLNYYNRTIEPMLAALADSMMRTFLTKTARSQHQAIWYARDPFRLVSAGDMAEIADKFTRNAILSSNEVRSIIGFRPSSEPIADELSNKNIPPPTEVPPEQPVNQ